MKCQDVRRELTMLLGHELSEGHENGLKQHVLNCSSCAREYLRLQLDEQRLREGLSTNLHDNDGLGLSEWVLAQATQLSEAEVNKKKQWVAGLFAEDTIDSKPAKGGRFADFGFKSKTLVACLVLIAIMFFSWPQIVRVSAQMPYVGEWVQQLVFRDAGLSWAYENGYMSKDILVAEKNGIRLTVLGTVADNVKTTVIYLLEVPKGNEARVSIDALNGNGIGSRGEQPIDTPLGKVGMVHTDPLPRGRHFLTVSVLVGNGSIAGPSLNIEVSREEISRLTREFELDYQYTIAGITVKADKVVYTPSQILINYTVSGGAQIEAPFSKYAVRLVDADGNQLDSSFGIGTEVETNLWSYQVSFKRPPDSQGLKFVIPILGRFEEVNLTLKPEDVGTEIMPGVSLISWEGSSNLHIVGEELQLGFVLDGPIRDFKGWTLLEESNSIDVRVTSMAWDGISTLYGFRAGSNTQAITVTYAQLAVEGNWEIPLPAVD